MSFSRILISLVCVVTGSHEKLWDKEDALSNQASFTLNNEEKLTIN